MIGTMLYDSYTQALGMVIAKADNGPYIDGRADWLVEWSWSGRQTVMSEGSMQIFIRDYNQLKKSMR